MTGLLRLRITAVIIAAAILLHEAAYALGASEEAARSHGYLETAVPVLVALACSLALASLLGSLLRPEREIDRPRSAALSPLAFAAALLAVFAAQELAEALLAGAGVLALPAVLTAAPLLLPLALALGLLAAALVDLLGWAGARIAGFALTRRPCQRRRPPSRRPPASPPRSAPSPLAFGLARRPPPRVA